jgi:hypothetical protein
MTSLTTPLPPPDSFDQSSSMWVDEAIWGHRLYDEQLPWMVFLEFLNVFHHEASKQRALEEPNGLNTLKYKAAHRLYLRNILFNNPHLADVRNNGSSGKCVPTLMKTEEFEDEEVLISIAIHLAI